MIAGNRSYDACLPVNHAYNVVVSIPDVDVSFFKSRDYVGRKSKPEWGLELNKKNYAKLRRFAFDGIVESL
jgi:hypothetical protein